MAKRRANGEGSLRKRPNGTWELTFKDGFRDDGKPKTISFYGKTQKEVKAKSEEYKSRSSWHRNKLPSDFISLSNLWYERHRPKVTPVTHEGYRYTLRILQNYFGDIRVEKILPMDIEDMLNALVSEGRSQSAISSCRAMMHQIMGMAVANGLIDRNPVQYAEKMRYENTSGRREAFTDEEVKLLMLHLPNDKIGMTIRLMLFTGLRTQEMIALEPRHISEDGSTISVEQAVKQAKGTAYIGETKTKSSVRVILVPENVRYCAVALRNTDKKFIWESTRLVDRPCNPSCFRDKFAEAVKSVDGVRPLTPHCCRHTFVSIMRSHEVDVNVIKAFTGHTQLKMIDHYSHVRDSELVAATEKISAAFPIDKSSNNI